MAWHPNPYALVLFISALLSGGVAVYTWRRRATYGIAPVVASLGCAEWSLGYAVATGVHDLTGRIFWAKVQHLGVAITPLALLVFVLQYTGRTKWLTRRNLILLAAVPFLGMLLAWTNEVHGLIWADIRLVIAGSVSLLDLRYGPYFWVYAAYNYLELLLCTILLLQTLLRSSYLQRRQTAALLAGLAFPWVANLLYLTGWNPFPHLDLTSFGYSLSSLVIAWGLFHYRLLDIVPVARDKVIENMSDGIIVLDVQARVVDANPAALQLIGRPAGEVIGQPAERILSERPDLVELYREVYEGHAQILLEEGGAQRYFDLRISPLHGRRGELTGRVVVLRDITEHLQVEKALRHYAAQLEASNIELDTFAHTVAHDLKNPLSTIIGFAEMLAEDYGAVPDERLPDQKVQEILQDVAAVGLKMDGIIRELLLLAGVRKMDVEVEALDMNRIVGEVQRRLRWVIEDSQAEVTLPAAWPVALGHGPWIEEVWANYVSNAIKYGGNPPRVELGAAEIADGGIVRFWVRDNGPGIPPEKQEQLFTAFTRLDRPRAEGHGLGLSIVKRVVEKLGGEVGVESELGQGSTFYFTLPGVIQ